MPLARDRSVADDTGMSFEGTCPVCQQGELITISMTVSGSDLSFTTCHMCEAKWWHRDGEPVPLRSVIGSVISQRT